MKDSPVKKLNFDVENKENTPVVTDSAPAEKKSDGLDMSKPITQIVKTAPTDAVKVAAGIKADEADEPLLQENPNRFVLFPIKYHEIWQMVSFKSTIYSIQVLTRFIVQESRGFILDC